MPSFDEVLKEAGEFGRFQKRVFFLLSQTGITFSSLFASVVFLGRAPGSFWCRIPGAAELSERCGWSLEEERNLTVLPLHLGNESVTGECERLDVTWDASASCASPLARSGNGSSGRLPLAPCHQGWVYEQPRSSIVSEYDLVCGSAWMVDLSQAILNLGFLAGAFILGYAADRYGRIPIYLLSCLGVGICGIIVAFSPNFTVFLIFRFLQGMFGKGTWMTCYVIVTEIVGSDQRMVGILIQIFFTLGIIILPGIAYLIPTWQGIQLAISLPNFLFLLYYWVVPESPRWLLTRKKGEKALKIMHNIAKHNGKFLSPHYSEITVSNEEVSNPSFLDLVRTPQMRRNTLILMYAWFTSALIYQGLVMRLGIIGGNLYLDFFISAVVELPSAFLIIVTIDRIGRRLPFAMGNIAASIACLITAFLPEESTDIAREGLLTMRGAALPCCVWVATASLLMYKGFLLMYSGQWLLTGAWVELGEPTGQCQLQPMPDIPWLKTTVATLGRLSITIAFEVVYLVNSELYPTTLRNFGVSLCSSLCDLGGIIAPFLLFRLAAIWLELPLVIFSILAAVCGLLVLLLPETKGISLPETVEDVEQLPSSHFGKCGKKRRHRDTNSYI